MTVVGCCCSMPSQRHFPTVLNHRQLGLFRPLKAVARVRIPSGLPVKPPLTRPDTTTSQPASPWVARQGGARDARTPTVLPSARSISRPRPPKHGLECRRSCAVARLDHVWDRRVPWHLQRRSSTITRHYGPEGLPDMSATTRHVRSALRMRDVDRSSRSSAASQTSHPLARTVGEK